MPAGLPRQIIHGDLKLTNFLFDERGGVVGIVDLDTFMYHNLYVELGDALRSWCTAGETFDLQLLEASLSGYAQSGAFEALDSTYLVAAVKLITLELAMRYLNDYFDDCYFQWDPQRIRIAASTIWRAAAGKSPSTGICWIKKGSCTASSSGCSTAPRAASAPPCTRVRKLRYCGNTRTE